MECLRLNHKYKFGIEIEFTNIYLYELFELFELNNMSVDYCINHKMEGYSFSKWCLDIDSTLTETSRDGYIGGELSSRILSNRVKDWEEIKRILDIINNSSALASDLTSSHIHVSIAEDFDLKLFLEYFSKIIAIYDNELRTFFMGSRYLERELSYEYARRLNPRLINKVKDVDFSNNPDRIFFDLIYSTDYVFTLRDGINLQNYNSKK